jgi:hypothetical protein
MVLFRDAQRGPSREASSKRAEQRCRDYIRDVIVIGLAFETLVFWLVVVGAVFRVC